MDFSKYKAKKMKVDGITFASTKEGWRYVELKALQQRGKIKDLQLQVPFLLFPSHKKRNGKKEDKATYVADFVYTILEPNVLKEPFQKGDTVVEDVKGYLTKEYKLKRKAMWYIHGIEIYET